MNVLVACEFSGTVRDAFARLGHNAVSCDYEPTTNGGGHVQCDLFEVIHMKWDLVIAHPPCTYLSAAGLHFCKSNSDRREKRDRAVRFVKQIFAADVPKIAIENPVGYLSTAWRKPDQVVYMNDFGHAEARKPTCLWLKNLPRLSPTDRKKLVRSHGKRTSKWYESVRDPKLRSITFRGFAAAMAEQWGVS